MTKDYNKMNNLEKLINKKILITGGAGFIGSNLCEFFIKNNSKIICLDNFSTGYKENITHLMSNKNFRLIEGDIRDLATCLHASKDVDYVLHHAALGSVPRSIKEPLVTNDVNITGFLNMLIASRDNSVKRFVYAASSSTYGDSIEIPKVENVIGNPLSPYAITKYVNELYANNFKTLYKLDCVGLRYFNVFGRRQDPKGAYAAVIPKFISSLIHKTSPVINGDGSYSRDFTYIDNVIQINLLAITTSNKDALNNVYNVACEEKTTLNELFLKLRNNLSEYDKDINYVNCNFGPNRLGDIPHSMASVKKAKDLLKYNPEYNIDKGLKKYLKWIMNNPNNEL
tara:strand:- start:154 stop:1176 length:1023 start_codon:yes stop_codon:yes gene_type:complete